MSRLAQTVLTALGALVLLLVSLDASVAALLRLRERAFRAPRAGTAEPEPPGTADYWTEWRTACRLPDRLRYTGDGVWHLEPFAGRAINIGADGLRRTQNAACGGRAPRIAMFGGSMLWGHGVPDDLTIPSLLSERFQREGQPVCISNHGEWGATTRSALAELLRELERPEGRPDVVVFYAGSYDAKEALLRAEGTAGSEIEAAIRAGEKRRRERWWFAGSALARLFGADAPGAAPRPLAAGAAEAAGDEAVRVVSEVQRLLTALAAACRFRPLVVWHPYALAGPKPLSPGEAAIVETVSREFPDLSAAIRRAYLVARERRAPGFHDLSGVFSGHRETLFIDAGHLNAAGNRIVADRLYEILSSPSGSGGGLP